VTVSTAPTQTTRPEPSTFEDLGVSDALASGLRAAGIRAPFPIQTLAIPDALAGRDVCGKARTGSGKTLAFGLPVIQRTAKAAPKRPGAVILVPTRELAVQVAEVIAPLAKRVGRTAEAFYGGVSIGKQILALRNGTDIVIATPGRLIDLVQRGDASLADVRMVVLDEADRMCDMGFLPQVERLLGFLRDRQQTMLFSATLDGAVDVIVRAYLRDPVFHDVVTDQAGLDTMVHYFFMVEHADKPGVVKAIVEGAEKVLVFTRTKRAADQLIPALRAHDVVAEAIHGDRQQNLREQALEDFASGKRAVLVATDVASRGLDIEGLDVVIHYDPPEDPKSYTHRSGRTARAGASGVVVTLATADQQFDMWLLQRAIGMQQAGVPITPEDPRLRQLASGDVVFG